MNDRRIRLIAPVFALSLALAIALAGCKSASPVQNDASLNEQVQSRLQSDQNLSGQPIQASVADGIVTLNGTVTSDTVRTIASSDVSQIPGIKTVVDNLVVQAPPTSAAATLPPPVPHDSEREKERKQREEKRRENTPPQPAPVVRNKPTPVVRNQPAPQPAPQPVPAPAVAHIVQAPPPPPPPPMPVIHTITLPAGIDIPVRITQTLDSATSQAGDKFTGEIASDILEDGMVVLPQGTPVTGHVDEVQDAKHYKGSSLLSISLTAINRKGEHIEVSTDEYSKQGEGRGKNTAEKVGGGAVLGAVLGGILGGGKGAAIGSVAGGGVGAGANTVTRGQQVQIQSETVVRFRLADAILVHVITTPSGTSGPSLEHHSTP